MITSLTVKNFRTLRDVTWKPGMLSILVGPNNSGKTNLCYALRFLSLSARSTSIAVAAEKACGAIGEVATRQQWMRPVEMHVAASLRVGDAEREFGYHLVFQEIVDEGDVFHGFRVLSERLTRADLPDDEPLLSREGQKISVTDETHTNQHFAARLGGGLCGPGQTALSCLPDDDRWRSAVAFREFLCGIVYYSMSTEVLRADASAAAPPALGTHGENIALTLKNMQDESPAVSRELVDLVAVLDPSVGDFECIPLPDGRMVFGVRDGATGEILPPASMSDGTLQYMALSMVALQAVRPGGPTLVIYEEPENGLFVRALHPLVDRLRDVSRTTQTVITTHNPFLLDFFDDRPEDIFVLRNGEHGTEVTPANPVMVDRLLETMSMGEMLYRELLTCE